MRPVAVLRFSASEEPAYFAQWMDAHGIAWDLVALDDGAAVPVDARAYSGIGMMGGYMGVNDPLPWIAQVADLVRGAVRDGVPVLGHCLGGQLLAHALGAPVTRTAQPEIGWVDVDVDTAHADIARAWFGTRQRFPVFQWHYDVFALPPRATRLLTNRFNPNQAYVLEDRHIGFQCHIEMTEAMVENWCASAADELPAESAGGLHSAQSIRSNLPARVTALHGVADAVYARWTQGLRA
jgi:GMP synthase-like glutamine amidotransferase